LKFISTPPKKQKAPLVNYPKFDSLKEAPLPVNSFVIHNINYFLDIVKAFN